MHTEEELRADIKFLISFVPATNVDEVESGLNPMFYITGKYEEDVKLIRRVQDIIERYGIMHDTDIENYTE